MSVARRLLLLVALVTASFAPAWAADLAGARRFVADLSVEAIQVMTGKGIPDAVRTQRFRHLFIGAVDMPVVSRLALGRYWRLATPDQRSQFREVFEDILVYTWANRFKNTQGSVQLEIRDTAPEAGGRVRVDSEIVRQNREPIAVVWHVRDTGKGWRIIDLDVAGTSMIITYRQEYSSYIAGHGGSVSALNQALRRKAAQLAASQGAG